MAKNNNVEAKAAAKAKKQKIILIVGGVLLLGLGAIQGPKLLGGGGSGETAPVATPTTGAATGAPTTGAATDTGATTAAPVAAAAFKPAGSVAGVALPGVTAVRVTTGQLASFTLFEVKDPFVQQGLEESATVEPDTAPPVPAENVPTATGSSAAAPAAPKAPAPPRVYATIDLDGEPQQMKVKQQFPTDGPLFVLVSVGKKQVKIGIAGGSFDDSETVTLKMGKTVTLVNVATNVRYVLKLVYTGSEPEAIESFSAETTTAPAGDPPADASTVSVAPGATP